MMESLSMFVTYIAALTTKKNQDESVKSRALKILQPQI